MVPLWWHRYSHRYYIYAPLYQFGGKVVELFGIEIVWFERNSANI